MARQRLTDTKIAALRPAPKRRLVADPECPGLYVRITPAGSRSFTVVARDPHGAQVWREVKGAVVGVDKISDVRERAREAIKRIKAGSDPFPPPPPKAESFKAVAENYLMRHVRANGLRSAAEIDRCLNVYVYPSLGKLVFTEIRRSDVAKLLDVIEEENGPRQADYVLAIIRGVMNWFASRTDDYSSPIVRRMARTKPAERKRERILSDDEIRLLWPILDTRGAFGAMLKLALLTGQRREKLLTMRWEDVSVDGLWTIPAEAREKGNAKSLQLPEAALEIIRAQPRIEGTPYVFAGRLKGQHINGFSRAKRDLDSEIAKRGTMAPWVVHDLRRSAKSLMARAQVPPYISERVLGHVIAGVEGTYDRHDYAPEMEDALERLAALVERILNPPADNVTQLAGRRKAGA
jgi:integrase